MRRSIFAAALLLVASSLAAQNPVLTGVVRQSGAGGQPLSGASVLVGTSEATTDPQGRFRFEDLGPGRYLVRVRRIGYHPLYAEVSLSKGQPRSVEYLLVPAPVLLPTVEVVAQRTGIYGVVGDTALHPLLGAKVNLLGLVGGDAVTDSAGRFAFPKAGEGAYMVQVTLPGYTERRFAVEVRKDAGRELAVRLAPESNPEKNPGEAQALWELGRRLASAFRVTRMAPEEIRRFGSVRLCEVPKLLAEAGDPATIILNGTTVLREVSLCAWRMDEIALIEFCSKVACFNPEAPRPLRYPDPSGRPRRGGAIALWEVR